MEGFVRCQPTVSAGWLALWLLVPGALNFHRKQLFTGRVYLGSWALGLIFYAATLGLSAAWWFFALASSIHSITATMAFVAGWPGGKQDRALNGYSVAGAIFTFLLYGWLLPRVIPSLVIPIAIEEHSVLVNPWSNKISRGDLVTCRMHYHYDARTEWTNDVLACDRVLALPGEVIHFYPDHFEVNGVDYRQLGFRMPKHGELLLPPDCYYIWPTTNRINPEMVTPEKMLQQAAIVTRDRVLGKVYERWFFRTQKNPPLATWTPTPSSPIGFSH